MYILTLLAKGVYIVYTYIMPRVNLYLTDEAFELWKNIDNKSQWVQNHLLTDKNYLTVNEALNKAQVPTERPVAIFEQPSIDEQLEEHGLVRDPSLPGQAFNPENDNYVPYKVIDGIVKV